MDYFTYTNNIEELKSEYKKLAFRFHPDVGGTNEQMQELNRQFEVRRKVLAVTVRIENNDFGDTFVRDFYTQNGWKGENYSCNLSTKEITKIIREGIKQMYPLTRWSVTFSSYSGGSSITATLMEAPYDVCPEIEEKHLQVNQYYIEKDKRITEQAVEMFKKINEFICSYRYDDSDAMIDYFCTNFYYNLHIGRWDKPFKVVNRTPRIGIQANPKDRSMAARKGYYDIAEDIDTRDRSKIWIVRIVKQLSNDDFKIMIRKMQSLGAYYSKFKKGFLFREDPQPLLIEM